MATFYKFPRGTRSALNSKVAGSTIVVGQAYQVTDESGRLAVGTAVNAVTDLALRSEANRQRAITFVIDGGGVDIVGNQKVDLPQLPFACTVNNWTITADASGSAVVDILRSTYANFPTMSSIAGTEKPTLSSAQKNQDTSLTTWTTSLAQGDILQANVDSVTGLKRITVTLIVTPT